MLELGLHSLCLFGAGDGIQANAPSTEPQRMHVREVSSEELHDLPQATQLTGGWKNHNLRHGQLQTGAMTPKYPGEGSPASVETTAFKKLVSSTGLPGRACTLHLKEKCSHLGRTSRQARVPLLYSMAKSTASLNE